MSVRELNTKTIKKSNLINIFEAVRMAILSCNRQAIKLKIIKDIEQIH